MSGETSQPLKLGAKDRGGASGSLPLTTDPTRHIGSVLNFYAKALSPNSQAFSHFTAVAQDFLRSVSGESDVAPERGDKRFCDPVWATNPMYRTLMQSFLVWGRELEAWVDGLDLDDRDKLRAKLLAGTLVDSFAPSNMLFGNPTAVNRMLETGGKSLVDGFRNFITDMAENDGLPAMVDKSKFKVGENLGTTPGDVVYREPHLELIQYRAQTEKVHGTPIFIAPPQINKFYVWDLAEGRSCIEYLVQQGFTVFVVSWFNPSRAQSDWGLESYVDALDRATAVACEISGSDQIHMIGACSGGITLALLAAYWAAKKEDRARSLTLLVAILDVEGAADTSIGLFANLETLEIARLVSSGAGMLKGKDLAKVFAWLRPNDLIWAYWVNNYLLGLSPPAFDILFWNADTTNMSQALHSDFITLLENNGAKNPAGLDILGQVVSVGDVTCDAFILGGTTDHITPWEGCYRTCSMLGGDTEFVLSASGHVQAIVNPPTNVKSSYVLNNGAHTCPEEFMETSEQFQGSWWGHWRDWLASRSTPEIDAPGATGSSNYPPLYPAPGEYVESEA